MIENAVLHPIMKKILRFFMKIQKFWAERSSRSLILRKTPVWSEQNLASCEQGSQFSVIFKFHMQVLILSKSSQNLLFSKIISTFWKNWNFVLTSQIFSKSSFIIHLILIKFCMIHLYLIVIWKLGQNWKYSQLWVSFPPPLPKNLKSSFIIGLRWNFVWEVFI